MLRGFLKFLTSSPVTIRQSLVRNMVLLVCLTCGAIGLAGYLAGTKTIETYSQRLIERTIDRTEAELHKLFNPVEGALQLAQDWARTGLLDPSDTESLNRLFVPILQRVPQMTSMLIANTKGEEWMLLRDGKLWKNRVTKVEEWGTQTFWREWSDSETQVKEWWEERDYDPRRRPWFKGGVGLATEDAIHWTEPYTFFTTKDPGITASAKWKREDGLEYIIGCDVKLIDISNFTIDLRVSPHGKAIVITQDGKVIGLPRDEKYSEEDPEFYRAEILFPPDKLGIPTLSDAERYWTKARPDEAFEFGSEGKHWWGGLRRFDLRNERFYVAVFIPRADFLDEFYRNGTLLFCVLLCVLGVGVIMAMRLAKRYSIPLERLASRSRRLRDLDLIDYHPVESRLAEVNQLSDAHGQMLTAMQSFAKYTPIEVVRELLKRGEVAKIGGQTASLTVMFSDIRGFTTIAESMTPQALTDHMAGYFEEALRVLHLNKATIDKFVGDAIVAFWGAPVQDPDHTRNAVKATLYCWRRLDELNREWERRRLPALPTCFGLTTGSVVVGNIGSPSRLSYTVLGDTANLASRIEGINRLYGTDILAEESVRQDTGEEFAWRYVDRITVKGKSKPVRVYELLGMTDEISEERLRFAAAYEEALTKFHARGFSEALAVLEGIGEQYSQDLSVNRLAGSCREFLQDPPPDDWDGVWHLEMK